MWIKLYVWKEITLERMEKQSWQVGSGAPRAKAFAGMNCKLSIWGGPHIKGAMSQDLVEVMQRAMEIIPGNGRKIIGGIGDASQGGACRPSWGFVFTGLKWGASERFGAEEGCDLTYIFKWWYMLIWLIYFNFCIMFSYRIIHVFIHSPVNGHLNCLRFYYIQCGNGHFCICPLEHTWENFSRRGITELWGTCLLKCY